VTKEAKARKFKSTERPILMVKSVESGKAKSCESGFLSMRCKCKVFLAFAMTGASRQETPPKRISAPVLARVSACLFQGDQHGLGPTGTSG